MWPRLKARGKKAINNPKKVKTQNGPKSVVQQTVNYQLQSLAKTDVDKVIRILIGYVSSQFRKRHVSVRRIRFFSFASLSKIGHLDVN